MTKRLWSYRMTYDGLTAPNPFFGSLTLAICKPVIRKNPGKIDSDEIWVAGFMGYGNNAFPRDPYMEKKEERLVYLARLTSCLEFEDYWKTRKEKRPVKFSVTEETTGDVSAEFGDNIYPFGDQVSTVISNRAGHGEDNRKKDVCNGKNVLIFDEFYYFPCGNRLLITDPRFRQLVHGNDKRCFVGQTRFPRDVDSNLEPVIDAFIEYVKEEAGKMEKVKSHPAKCKGGVYGDLQDHIEKLNEKGAKWQEYGKNEVINEAYKDRETETKSRKNSSRKC